MDVNGKIAILYKDRPPQFLAEPLPPDMPWALEFFHEREILCGPQAPRNGFLAVFFPLGSDESEIRPYVSNIFWGAGVVGYLDRGDLPAGTLSQSLDGLQVVQLPMPISLAAHLLEDFATVRAYKEELLLARRRADEIRDFFEAYVNTIESTANPVDRRLGMSHLISKILSRVRAEECALYLVGGDDAALQRAYNTGNIRDFEFFEHQANNAIVERVLRTGEPYLNNDYMQELRIPFSRESVQIRSLLCYPIVRRGERLGVLEFINKVDGAFSREDQSLVEMMLTPIAVAIQSVHHFEDAERLTITDDLTKLYNYRYLMKYLEADVKRCLRYKKKVSLLFIDVDGFKRINDTFGHLVGSQALAEMGQVFKRIVRETDVVGRYGGDEFVIVLPETPLNGAMVIAERIRKQVEEYEFVSQNVSIRLTVSLGVANCPKHTLTAEGLIKKADAAMYRAKELSKNSIKVAV